MVTKPPNTHAVRSKWAVPGVGAMARIVDKTAARMIGRSIASASATARSSTHDMAQSVDRMAALAAHYNNDTLSTPSRFFPAPSAPHRIDRTVVASPGVNGAHVVDLAFASEYQPFLPEARGYYERYLENNTVHARLWTLSNKHQIRPVMLLVHGYAAADYRISESAFEIGYWLHHGFDVCAMQLPFHGRRSPKTRREISHVSLFPSANIVRTNEAFGQAIYDLRTLAGYFRADGVALLGAIGMSLGGYITALWTTVATDLDFAVALVPAVSMSELMWQHSEDSAVQSKARQAGIDQQDLHDAFTVHSPLARPPLLAPERLFVIAGKHDRITPPEQAIRLAAHWKTDVLWFDGGHLAQLGRHQAFGVVRRALQTMFNTKSAFGQRMGPSIGQR
jgi:pimeloyl-ACP methyl ester carboxylesterase